MTDIPSVAQPVISEEAYDGGSLYNSVVAMLQSAEDRELEEWLLALYGLVRAQDEPKTIQELVQLLGAAFTAPPAEFDPDWLQITALPEGEWLKRNHTGDWKWISDNDGWSLVDSVTGAPIEIPLDGYQILLGVIQFQIAEVHRMQGDQMQDEYRYFGLKSPTGHQWYNFDPKSILECGAAGLGNHDFSQEIGWGLLADLLETGREYE